MRNDSPRLTMFTLPVVPVVPEHDGGSAALALSQDCEAFAFDDETPAWAQ